MSDFKVEYLFVTPEMAAKWLAIPRKNRPVRPNWATELAKRIEGGVFNSKNGETIKLGPSGDVIDGQHRLEAIVRSGVGVFLLVVFGVHPDSYDTIDDNARRSFGDTVATGGLCDGCNATALSGAANIVWRYENGALNSNLKPSNHDIDTCIRRHPELKASVVLCTELKGPCSPHVMGALHYIGIHFDKPKTEDFIRKLSSGIGLSETEPAYVLREALHNLRANKKHYYRYHVFALAVKAIKHHFAGTPCRLLRFNAKKEEFPTLGPLATKVVSSAAA